MLPILTAAQMRAADEHTIASGIASVDLMERAAGVCAARILKLHEEGRMGDPDQAGYLVVAGMGNNGGDGLVIARLLAQAGLKVRVLRVLHKDQPSQDHAVNLDRLGEMPLDLEDLHEGDGFKVLDHEVIIDALFGTGLAKPVGGWVARLIHTLNSSGRPVIAIDMPSGLFADDNSENDLKAVVRATVTFTFETPKLAQLLPDMGPFVGRLEVIPIGLDSTFIRQQAVYHFVVQEQDVVELLPPRPWHGHKGTFGHALLMAGSRGKAGAAVIAVRSALRSGAGLVTAHVPEAVLQVVQRDVPEAMCSWSGSDQLEEMTALDPYTAIGMGPGIGTGEGAQRLIRRVIQEAGVPLVLDADALNILSENPTWLAFLPPSTILTPHPKEFDRLAGTPSRNDHERLERAHEMARRNKVIVILKGFRTAVCDPVGKVFFNPTGNPGMARGGSGDSLTGVITGLLAQRMSPLRAAILGVYLHGLAGDLVAEKKGMDGMSISDLIEALPMAWQQLRARSKQTLDGSLSLP